MNEFLCCYHLNELSVVELFLSDIYFLGPGFTKKKSGIFVSFPFSALRSERQLTLSILFYVNAGRSGWKWIPYKTNNEVCFLVVLRRRVSEIHKIGFIN